MEGYSHSFRRMSTANMDVTDCVSNNRSMEYYENRLSTFATYPKQMLPDKFQLARAGLYYTGKSDICQCFQCHVKLSSWKRDDDPTKEHFKWSRNCKDMKMIEAPQQRHSGFTFGSSATSFGGFEMGSSNMMKPLDPKVFQTWREDRNDVMETETG